MTGSASTTDVTVPRAVATTALLAVTLLGAVSCTTPQVQPPTPAASSPTSAPAASPSANAEENEARDRVLAAYDGYREAYIAAAAIPDPRSEKLRDFIADPLLALVKADLQTKAEKGYVVQGRPTWTVKVVKVNVAQRPFTVETEECFDGTNWKLVKRSTGKPVPVPEQNKKYLVTSEAAQFDDGRWLIRRSEAQRDRPC